MHGPVSGPTPKPTHPHHQPQQTPRPDPSEESYVDDEGGWTYVPDSERDALVQLASVQTMTSAAAGRRPELARAAEQYRDPTSDDELGTDDWVDSCPTTSGRY